MRMLLTSNGLTNESLRGACLDLLGKPFEESAIIVVLDAFLAFGGDKGQLLEHLQDCRSLGWREFDVTSLLASPRSMVEPRLRTADVIYCYGGSNHWLAHAWRTTGLAPVLAELLETKVYLGMSAGSMIFSRRHAETARGVGEQAELATFGLASASAAVPLFDWVLDPHLGADFMPHKTEEWARLTASHLGAECYFLDDDTGLVIRDPQSDPEAVSEGRWLHIPAS